MKKGAHGHYFIPFNRYNPQIIDLNQALYVVRSKVWFYAICLTASGEQG